MKVVMIGSGNVATVIGKLLSDNNHKVLQVMSRNLEHARKLGIELGASFSDYSKEPMDNADIYIFSISDQALEHCLIGFNVKDKLVVHTAGAVSLDLLKGKSSRYGVIYPLQSLRKEMSLIPTIPLLIEGNTPEVTESIREFAVSISDSVTHASGTERLKLHAAAVFVNNFSNHLFALAHDFCEKEKVDFDLLKPLILQTAQRIEQASPFDSQTGPAIRNDLLTMDKHMKLLGHYPNLQAIYDMMTESILSVHYRQ
jgi:predicted short-subunit dehydrogenase-like oxidoreductase (DUF2520 family)